MRTKNKDILFLLSVAIFTTIKKLAGKKDTTEITESDKQELEELIYFLAWNSSFTQKEAVIIMTNMLKFLSVKERKFLDDFRKDASWNSNR